MVYYDTTAAYNSLEYVDIWDCLLSSCGDAVDNSILQLARAGYNRRETAGKLNIGIATVYRRLQGILARYRETA